MYSNRNTSQGDGMMHTSIAIKLCPFDNEIRITGHVIGTTQTQGAWRNGGLHGDTPHCLAAQPEHDTDLLTLLRAGMELSGGDLACITSTLLRFTVPSARQLPKVLFGLREVIQVLSTGTRIHVHDVRWFSGSPRLTG